MRILIADDDFPTRWMTKRLIESYGNCDMAVNGREALESFRMAYNSGASYDLILLDIMMPEMDGQQVLKEIRDFEASEDIHGLNGVKIVMTTSLDDKETIITAFHSQCEGYLVKPIDRKKLIDELQSLGLLKDIEA